MGSSGGADTSSKGNRKNVTRVELPAWYDAELRNLNSRARAVYDWKDREAYPSMYTGMDPATTRGLGMVEALAGSGSGVPRDALSEWGKTVRGDYLDPASNPWLRDVADRAGYEAEQRVNSQYATGGASSGGAFANALADAQVGTRNALYADNYQAERARMQAALGMAPMAENLQYADAARLGMVGQRREEDALARAAEANRQYQKPFDDLSRYAEAVYGNPIQRAVTASEKGSSTERSSQKNAFDWAAFVGGLLG